MAQAAIDKSEPKGYAIKLFVYDLSGGLAKIYSPQLVGKVIEGIWHSCMYIAFYFVHETITSRLSFTNI